VLRNSPGGGEQISNFVLKIRDWLINLVVQPVLLYRLARYGYTFRRIRMSGPKYAKVDPADYKRLRKYEWLVMKSRNSYYSLRIKPGKKGGSESQIYMHKEILKVPKGMVVDHINRDSMDNRIANLRAATHSQNMCNKRKCSGATYSKYKGIHWHKLHRKWKAAITFEKKRIYLGSFDNEIDAAKAYDEAAKKYHGEFACLNFPE
jgi:hypothetical protein